MTYSHYRESSSSNVQGASKSLVFFWAEQLDCYVEYNLKHVTKSKTSQRPIFYIYSMFALFIHVHPSPSMTPILCILNLTI